MGEDELKSLADDIKANGQRAPVTTLDGLILDGRNRFRACEIAEVEPKTRAFAGDDPLGFVISANLHRRHLNETQRAVVAAKIANLKSGERPPIGGGQPRQLAEVGSNGDHKTPKVSVAQAAKIAGAAPRNVERVKAIMREAPEKVESMANGTKTAHAATKEIREAKAEKSSTAEVQLDETGYAIPTDGLELWNRRGEIKEVLHAISKLRGIIRAAMKSGDLLWAPSSPNGILGRLDECFTGVSMSELYSVCCTCQGRAVNECMSCKGRGFISSHHYERCVPIEIKAVRDKSCVKK